MSETSKPYHPGEVHFQKIMGSDERLHIIGKKILRTHVIEQHRLFFESLPYAFISVLDDKSRPWSFMLEGAPGFIQVVEPNILRIQHALDFPVPKLAIDTNDFFALVGLDYGTRRRNLLNGYIAARTDQYIDVQVKQSFGNCPKYIQTRHYSPSKKTTISKRSERISKFTSFTNEAQEIISKSDTFYIASAHPQPHKRVQNQGIDINHRGGKPGFVELTNSNQLSFQNYPGNNMFYSFGNIELNPRTGLLFINFELGDLYHLTGTSVIEKKGKEFRVIFELDQGYVEKQAFQSSWEFLEYSPALELI